MNKEEIISILRKQNVMNDIVCGPTVLIISNKGKKIPVRVTLGKRYVNVSIGKVLRRIVRIPISEMEQ